MRLYPLDSLVGAGRRDEAGLRPSGLVALLRGQDADLGGYGQAQGEVFLGRDYTRAQDYSDEVATLIDEEVRKLITRAHEEARAILSTHREALGRLAAALLERETLSGDAIDA